MPFFSCNALYVHTLFIDTNWFLSIIPGTKVRDEAGGRLVLCRDNVHGLHFVGLAFCAGTWSWAVPCRRNPLRPCNKDLQEGAVCKEILKERNMCDRGSISLASQGAAAQARAVNILALQGCKIACFAVMKVPFFNVLQQSAFNGVTIAEVKDFIWNQVYIILLFGDLAGNAVQIL